MVSKIGRIIEKDVNNRISDNEKEVLGRLRWSKDGLGNYSCDCGGKIEKNKLSEKAEYYFCNLCDKSMSVYLKAKNGLDVFDCKGNGTWFLP